MKTIGLVCRRLLLLAVVLYSLPAISQKKYHVIPPQRKDFYHLLAQANLQFAYPVGFREIPAVNNEDFSYDFAMELPSADFEVWVQVNSQKQNWISYLHSRNDVRTRVANPDSMYMDIGRADAIALTGDDNYLVRNIPRDVLARYNADAGKSYLLNLLDMPETKHYKYALIISLQQNHTGTLVIVYFTNQKNPDFYKNVNRAGRAFRFKPAPVN